RGRQPGDVVRSEAFHIERLGTWEMDAAAWAPSDQIEVDAVVEDGAEDPVAAADRPGLRLLDPLVHERLHIGRRDRPELTVAKNRQQVTANIDLVAGER